MRNIVIGTAGHIDHGKSALVRALTGTDPDRLQEEKLRGITIDLGFANWSAGEVNVAFVDVPGHERFVRNMLAGVGGIDAVLLVVAADESVMPQTREHFEICRLLRVPAGIVALTKSDLVDADTIELVRLEVRDMVAGSFLEGAPVLPVSSKTGEGLGELQRALLRQAQSVAERAAGGPVRLPVDRVFSMRGFGTVVTGTLVSGEIGLEQELQVMPEGRLVKVRGIQVHGRSKESVAPGNRVAVNVGGVETSDIGRGCTITTSGSFISTRVIDVVIETVGGVRPLAHGARVRFHQGTSEVLGRIALAGPVAETLSANVAEIPPGSQAYARLRLEAPAVVTRGDRFIVRAYSPPRTIAGGLVLDPQPPRVGIRRPGSRQRFEAMNPEASPPAGQKPSLCGPDERTVLLVTGESGAAGLGLSALTSRLGIASNKALEIVDSLETAGEIRRVEDRLITAAVAKDLSVKVLAMLGEYHKAQPLSDGMSREEVRERLFAGAASPVFETVLADLFSAGLVSGRDRLALASHRMSLSPEEERARDTIEASYREAGLRPADPAAVARAAGVQPVVADRMVQLLVRQKRLVRVEGLLFHSEVLETLRQDVAAMKTSAGPGQVTIDVATFKERYGISRKFAIPLLELLDRERLTRRMGDVRVIL
ncbi:MAG: selenocysteine-specific translation elongation factor [Vicinamibacterales bacterium]